MSGERLTAARLSTLVERLDERDLAIIGTLRNLRMGTGRQLKALHMPTESDRQARRTLARLVELGVLARLGRTIGGKRAGSAGYLFALGVAGQRLSKGLGPAGGQRVASPWTPSVPFVRHILAGTELLVRLTQADRAGLLELLAFEGEPLCWRRFYGATGLQTLKPDAFIRIGLGDFEDSYFVEIDLATESPATLDRKLQRYRAHATTGLELHRAGVQPRVLWLVPDDARKAVVVAACARQPADSWSLHRVAIFDDAVAVMAAGATS